MSKPTTSPLFLKAYEDYSDAIFRFCYVRLRNRDLALDIMQETFIKTWEYLGAGKEVLNLRAFLYRVANNLIIDYSRKKKETSLDNLMEQGFDAPADDDGNLHKALDAKYIIRIVQDMDEKYRDVLLLRYVDDLSIKDIADIVGESENVVSVRIHRGVQQVRKILANG
jgi:RNA polymerase sigma-70 factor, ECF subfamily